jgi:hypothetical protein
MRPAGNDAMRCQSAKVFGGRDLRCPKLGYSVSETADSGEEYADSGEEPEDEEE